MLLRGMEKFAVKPKRNHKILMPGAISDNQRVHLHQFDQGLILSLGNPFQELDTAVAYPLAEAQMLELLGADARAFAQSQFTSDVTQLVNGKSQWSAWLDANGRVRYLFALLQVSEDQLFAWLPRGQATNMAAALHPFVFRSKVRIQPLTDFSLFGLGESGHAPTSNSTEQWSLDLPGTHPRQVILTRREAASNFDERGFDAWTREDITCGLAWIPEQVSGRYTPSALGLERLEAVSLNKGCYPGQEIVARLHYRGGNKRGCMRIHVETEEIPIPGTEVMIESVPPSGGSILYAARAESTGCEALAVLPLDIPESAALLLSTGARIKRLPIFPANPSMVTA